MIRVLHIVTYMGRGGIETMLMNYYRKIDRERIQFDFLVHRDFEADYDAEILSLGGRIFRLPMLNPFSVDYRRKLNCFFMEHKEYSIVHSHIDSMSAIPLKYAKKNGIPVRIAHAHNCAEEKNIKYYLKLYYKRQLSNYANVRMACSDEAGKWLFGNLDYILLSNAIDTEQYKYDQTVRKTKRKELGIAPDTLVVGNVARFFPQKNHTFMVQVFNELLIQKPNSVLVLVGEGDSKNIKSEIEHECVELGIKDKVMFLGVRNDVPQLLQAMDVYLFPSLFEGLPVSIIEAQTAGLPCLISDKVPIECKKTDLVYVCNLADDISEWVKKILQLGLLKRKDGKKAIVDSGFDINNNVSKLEQFYIERFT